MEGWDAIRDLDNEENWAERNRVVSRTDHLQLMESAEEIVADLVQSLPIGESPSKPDSTNYELTDEDFQPYSAAQFDMDYLEGISSEASSDPSALSRKSLFVKFDPLMSAASPKGRVPLGDHTHLSNVAPQDGDLLMLSTPPPRTLSHNGGTGNQYGDDPSLNSTNDTVLPTNHVAVTTLVNCLSSPQPTADVSSQLEVSTGMPSNVEQSDHTPPPGLPSTELNAPPSDPNSHPNTERVSSSSASSHAPSALVTDNLVEVLKYSEHSLPEILEAARRQQREIETAKYDGKVRQLKQRIEKTRKHLLQKHKKKDTLHSKSVHVLADILNTEEQINKLKEKVALCVGKENDLCNKHKDYKSKVSDLEEQFDIISKDSSSLENSFDELHHHYLRLKAVHQKLSASNKILNQHLAELRDWEREDTDYTITLQRELQEIEMRAEEKFVGMRDGQETKLSVEKSRIQKLQVQQQNLEETYKLKVVERDEAAKICDELMQVFESSHSQQGT